MKSRPESEVKREVVRTLKQLGCMVFRMNAGKMSGSHKGKAWFVQLAPAGTADILAFVGRFPLWIETKREGCHQSPAQMEFEALVHSMGHHYVVARDTRTVFLAVQALRGFEQ